MLALTDIAVYSGNGASVSAPEIAERQDISQKYLEQILTHLKQAGLIRAQKGKRGGYTLSRPAETIRLTEVINALDNSILEGMRTPAGGHSLRAAVNTCLWEKMNSAMVEFAESKTLAAFAEECRDQASGGWDLYMI